MADKIHALETGESGWVYFITIETDPQFPSQRQRREDVMLDTETQAVISRAARYTGLPADRIIRRLNSPGRRFSWRE